MNEAYTRTGRLEVQQQEELPAQIPAVLEKACTAFCEWLRGSPEACSVLDVANIMLAHAVRFFLYVYVTLAALLSQHTHLILKIVIHHVMQ